MTAAGEGLWLLPSNLAKKQRSSNLKKTFIGIAAAAAVIGIIVTNAPAIRDEFSSLIEEKPLSIKLVSDMPDDVSFSPGAEIPLEMLTR